MSNSAQQTAQATQPDVASPSGESKLTLDEMTRVMDVARTLRKERSIAERELNREDTVKLLRLKLREAADIAGDPVTDEQIDAAIEHYFDNLHEFDPPEPGFETALAGVYVRRKLIAGWAVTLAAAAIIAWGAWFNGMLPGHRQTELRAAQTYSQVEEVIGSIEAIATDSGVSQQAQAAKEEAATYRDRGELSALQQLHNRLLQQETVLKKDYRILIVSEGQTGIDRYVGVNRDSSGYYLVVEAVDAAGKPVLTQVRNAETNQYERATRWAEQVPKEVYDRVAADKQADGIVDAREFAVKRRGETDVEVTLQGVAGGSLERGRQITKW